MPSIILMMLLVGSAFAGDTEDSKDRSKPLAVARATAIPACALFADAQAPDGGDGTVAKPHKTIAAAVEAAKPGAVICVAEGVYPEQLKPGEKHITLAGGFQKGKEFKVRDSAQFVAKAQGKGGSFVEYKDPAPSGDKLTAIDGFEITGYSQAIVRDYYEPQRFDITNNFIHGNKCAEETLVGAGFALNNVSGTIRGNVIQNNSCGRGGGGFLNDTTNKNTVIFDANFVDGNAGTEPDASHGGALYFFGNTLSITNNLIINNTVTQWGGGLYIGAFTPGNQPTTATLKGNVYRGNRAGNSGGGFFCDDGAACDSSDEVYASNCGGNVLVDGGGPTPTTMKLDHITSVGALDVGCKTPGIGFFVNTYEGSAADSYTITNSIFWDNAEDRDLATSCSTGCQKIQVNVSSSMVQTKYANDGLKIEFGKDNVAPADPTFIAPDKGDYRLQPNSPAAGKGADISLADASPQVTPAPSPTTASSAKVPDAAAPPSPASTPKLVAEAPVSKPTSAIDAPAAVPPPAPSPAAAASPSAADEAKIKQAFDEAKSLGTIAAWRAFLANYPEGFYADMAGAYLRSLGYTPGSGAPSPLGPATAPASAPTPPQAASPPPASAPAQPAAPPAATPPSPPQTAETPPPPPAAKPVAPTPAPASAPASAPAASAALQREAPAVRRGGRFFAFPEQFNRYYTDPSWKPVKTIFAGPNGGGDGSARDKPATLSDAANAARPGTMIYVTRGSYKGGIEFTKQTSGTYDAPIVLFAERMVDGSPGVTVDCAFGSRKTCFNFEDSSYIAVDGFELVGGTYGVRAVGSGFPASQHSRGIAILNSKGHDQERDPFKTAQADWSVIENNLGYGAKKGDGHGIYISGGSDWGIVRLNETHSNESSDLQINADPASACQELGIPYNDPRCDAYAGQGEGGQGASDYFLVEGNYCHRSTVGPNFTSLRRSMIRNNIFGPQVRHNASFWQETDNPKLGSTENRILNNLFITTKRHALKFENNSGRNIFTNNIVLGVTIDGKTVTANPSALLMETDATSASNLNQGNFYISGTFEGRKPGDGETAIKDFSQSWFAAFPADTGDSVSGFTPAAGAPFLNKGKATPDVPTDRSGTVRRDPIDLGPIEAN